MNNHWDKNLNVRQLLEEYKPKMMVECGAGSGENTAQYLEAGYLLTVISDGEPPERLKSYVDKKILRWIFGLSYIELENFKDGSIDFCSIDTDHNYWTLKQEIDVLRKKLSDLGIIVIHDTETYRNNSGKMDGYNCRLPYPAEIGMEEKKGRKYGDAIREAVLSGDFFVLEESIESNGATALMIRKVR